ncbi:MAG TPA: tetratricopeptide repeat protein [Gemmatimonadales bacterium]|nr:tetratricopeptide repeat protein [Gemmatimonadales bacterium]
MNELVCDAIAARRRLRFVYEGYERIVEPHLYGINTANHEALSAWLVAGWTASTPEPGWRNYLVAEMADVHVLATPFEGPRPGYNPDDPGFRQIFCRLAGALAGAGEGIGEGAGETPNADALYHAGRSRMEAGDAAGALALLERSVALEPHFLTLELLGECLLALGRPREAIVPLAASTGLHLQSRAPARLAEVLLALGRREQADELAGRALAVDPDNEAARAVRETVRREREG